MIKATIKADSIVIYPKRIRIERAGKVVLLERTFEVMRVNLSGLDLKKVKKREPIYNVNIEAINAGVGKIYPLLR